MSVVPLAIGIGAIDALILAEAVAAWREYRTHPRDHEPDQPDDKDT